MPKPDGGFYGVNDLKVGMQIDLYSRVLQVTDADGFTRAFMEKIGNTMGEKLPTPEDPYTRTRDEMKQEIVRNHLYCIATWTVLINHMQVRAAFPRACGASINDSFLAFFLNTGGAVLRHVFALCGCFLLASSPTSSRAAAARRWWTSSARSPFPLSPSWQACTTAASSPRPPPY